MSEHDSVEQFDIDSHEKVREVVELAMRGAENGEIADLKKAFHEKAQMFGEVQGERFDEPIKAFFELCTGHKLGAGGRYRSRVVSITRVGGAAMAMVAEDGCWGSASFVDFFTVTLIKAEWKITNKTFVYTGGKIPLEVLKAVGLAPP